MKYAVIAAGEGSRLAAEGVAVPKPLVQVGGECLIDRLVRIFMDNGADDIVVICNEQMTPVAQHLLDLQRDGLQGRPVPLRFIVKSTPSSMHSLYEIALAGATDPFILTTVDTIFREEEFAAYVAAFRQQPDICLMGVTDYVDDEKPLYVTTDNQLNVTGFHDTLPLSSFAGRGDESHGSVSAGIYGLNSSAVHTLYDCIARGESRMRNFQRALLADGRAVRAWRFGTVFDIDHASDILKANRFLADD